MPTGNCSFPMDPYAVIHPVNILFNPGGVRRCGVKITVCFIGFEQRRVNQIKFKYELGRMLKN